MAITPDVTTQPKQPAAFWRRLLGFSGLWVMGAPLMSLIVVLIG